MSQSHKSSKENKNIAIKLSPGPTVKQNQEQNNTQINETTAHGNVTENKQLTASNQRTKETLEASDMRSPIA